MYDGHEFVCFMKVEGSLLFTNNEGTGFKVFGRGTDFEAVTGGKFATQRAKEAEEYEKALAAWNAAMPEGLQHDLDMRESEKYFPNDAPLSLDLANVPRTSLTGI